MNSQAPSLEEIVRIILIINGDVEHNKEDKIKTFDIEQALMGNLCAIRRVRKALQHISRLIPQARKELQNFK